MLSTKHTSLSVIALLFCLVCCKSVLSQRVNVWYFGYNAGINFNGVKPVGIGGSAITTNEGCAVICDANGDIIFYTDGIRIYNANHAVINPGTLLHGNSSATQSAVVIPKPETTDSYIIFTVDKRYSGCKYGLNYSEVKVTNGNVSLVSANTNLMGCGPSTERIAATAHANGKDYWVTTNKGNGEFESWLVDKNGVNMNSIISPVKAVPSLISNDRVGYMKISPSGKYLVLGRRDRTSKSEAFIFDNTSGKVTKNLGIYKNGVVYGVEFSSDEKYFYISNFSKVIQYDWSFNRKVIHTSVGGHSNFVGALQMGPDGNIYVANGYEGVNSKFIDQITDVNKFGATYNDNFITLPSGAYSRLGLPNVVSSFLISLNVSADKQLVCKGDTVKMQASFFKKTNKKYLVRWFANNSSWTDTGVAVQVYPKVNTVYKAILLEDNVMVGDTQFIPVSFRAPATWSISPDKKICKGQTATLQVTANGGKPLTYKVSWADLNSAWINTGLSVNVSPPNTTKYRAVFTEQCTEEPDTQYVNVSVLKPLNISGRPDTTICVGEQVNLTVNTFGGDSLNHTISWYANSSYFGGNSKVQTVSPITTTVYKVILNDFCTVKSDSVRITVNVREPLQLQVNPDTTICTGEEMKLNAIVGGGYAINRQFKWEEANSWDSTELNVTIKPITTTTYTASLIDGCTSPSITKSVTVTVRPPLSVNLDVEDSVCSNEKLKLQANISGGYAPNYNVVWNDLQGIWSSIDNPATHNPQTSTTYVLTVSDNCSKQITDTATVTVISIIPNAKFTAFPREGCPPLQVTFKDSSTGNDTAKNVWIIEGDSIVGGTTTTYLFNTPGEYDIKLKVFNSFGCFNNYDIKNSIQVYDKPRAQFSVRVPVREINYPVYILNLSERANVFFWKINNELPFTTYNTNEITHSFSDSGYHQIQLIAQNALGCKDTQTQRVRIFENVLCFIPNAFTPNTDDRNEAFFPVCTGLNSYELSIYNRWGQLLYQCENCSWDGTFKRKKVPDGVYLYTLSLVGDSKRKSVKSGTFHLIR
ncbi:MAG: gliding motility-associated C-terminal domain-containing protein [bacterium]